VPQCAAHHCHGLPDDAPLAFYASEPRLPKPNGWPSSNTVFPRTSGTGRVAHGAFYWTDFLYDDHGTVTASTGGISVTAGTPSFGTYTYPAGAARNNGADIFRAAVARTKRASYWRVDWTTLKDPRIPVAEWTLDRDDNSATGTSDWAGAAGATSAGIDTALIMSAKGARLIDLSNGHSTPVPMTVDRRASSFIARIPRSVLRTSGDWRVRLGSGLADASGSGFAPAADSAPGQTAIYNAAFRTRTQEPVAKNYWDDETQSMRLATGDMTPFSKVIRWRQLRKRIRTPEPRPRGWSDRWYVSSIRPGNGVRTDPATIADGKANYLGSVQPYAIYVPHNHHRRAAPPLTFLLHSSDQNHNQYAATTPNFVKGACEQRGSICVTPLGRGPDGSYWDSAELDFWQVWHAVAASYHPDPTSTILAGYSMGGTGSNQLAMEHPDLFARSITLAGGIGDIDSLVNLRWVPTYLAGGAEDELVPVTLQAGEANELERLGYRFRWAVVSAIDHVSYELADSFADAVRYMSLGAPVVAHPGRIDFTWTPSNTGPPTGQTESGIGWTQRPKLGVMTTGAYWLRQLRARNRRHDASIVAKSGERPDRAVTAIPSQKIDPTFAPEPAVVTTQRWTLGSRHHARPILRLRLRNVGSLRVLLRSAGFRAGMAGRLIVTTRTPVTISLGHRIRHVPRGHHVIRFVA